VKFNPGYNDVMFSASEHECLIYEGSSEHQFRALASVLDRKLKVNYRCLYMASPSMISDFRSCLVAQGTNVDGETAQGNLLLSSAQNHLLDGWQFDVESMLQMLARALEQAVSDGYQGLWATGDIAWEFGPKRDFSELVAYEVLLENFVRQNPNLGGICQYHADKLPREVVRDGLLVHHRVFADESSSFPNSWYSPESFPRSSKLDAELDSAIDRILLARSTDPRDIMVQLSASIRGRAEELAIIEGISLEDFIMFAVAEKVARFDPPTLDPDHKPSRPH
jgi:hypothetical protein